MTLSKERKTDIAKIAAFLGIFVLFFVLYVVMWWQTTVEVPHLSWADVLRIADPFYAGTLQAKDLFTRYGEHGLFGYNLLLLLNLSVFGGTVFFDVVVNDLVIAIFAVTFFLHLYFRNKGMSWPRLLAFSVLFSLTFCQWSQLTSGSMETQVRLSPLFFVPLAILFQRISQTEAHGKRWQWLLFALTSLLTINVFGTMYTFAFLPCVLVFVVASSIKNRRFNWRSLLCLGILALCTLLYFYEYNLLKPSGAESSIKDNIVYILTHIPEDFNAVFAYYGAALLSYSNHTMHIINDQTFIAVGGFVVLAQLYAIYLYIRYEGYKKSYLPVLLISYSFFVCAFVMVGRSGDYGWLMAEWYAVHVKYSIAGTVWIYASTFLIHLLPENESEKEEIQPKKKSVLANVESLFILLCSVFLTVGTSASYYYEGQFLPYVHSYYAEKQGYLLIRDAEEMPVDANGNTPLLLPLDKTMKMIDTLYTHKLSIYRPGYINYSTNYEQVNLWAGVLDHQAPGDPARWFSTLTIIPMNSGNGGFDFEFYMPDSMPSDDTITITFGDDVLVENKAMSHGYNHIFVDTEKKNANDLLRIKTKYNVASGQDARILGLLALNLHFLSE